MLRPSAGRGSLPIIADVRSAQTGTTNIKSTRTRIAVLNRQAHCSRRPLRTQALCFNSSCWRKMKIAYILGTFPALSETFILREIRGLMARGCEVRVFAIKRASNAGTDALGRTGDALPGPVYARPDSIVKHFCNNLLTFATSPRSYLRILGVYTRESLRFAPSAAVKILYHFFCGVGFGRMLRGGGYDRIHGHFTGADIAIAASVFSGLPFSWTAQASNDIYVMPVLLKENCATLRLRSRYLDTTRRISGRWHRASPARSA